MLRQRVKGAADGREYGEHTPAFTHVLVVDPLLDLGREALPDPILNLTFRPRLDARRSVCIGAVATSSRFIVWEYMYYACIGSVFCVYRDGRINTA